MITPPKLESEHLIITALHLDHWEEYAQMWANPETTRFIGEARDRRASWDKFCQAAGLWPLLGYGYFAFIAKKQGTLVGVGGLSRFERGIDELVGYPEAGWAIAPQYWRKGYATEAMQTVMEWADSQLAVKETRCIIDSANIASKRICEKLGFVLIKQTERESGPLGIYSRKAR